MKIIVKAKDTGSLTPRHVRNYIGAIVDEEYKDICSWHKHSVPELIYPKPYSSGFEIISVKNNLPVLAHIAKKIEENRKFYGRDIEEVWSKDEQFGFPRRGIAAYQTRTPIVIGSNKVEYGIAVACAKKGRTDDLKRYIGRRIKSDVEYYVRAYFGINISIPDLSLNITELKQLFLNYKEGVRLPMAAMSFTSNYSLPRFVGYKIGLGWGELIERSIVEV